MRLNQHRDSGSLQWSDWWRSIVLIQEKLRLEYFHFLESVY